MPLPLMLPLLMTLSLLVLPIKHGSIDYFPETPRKTLMDHKNDFLNDCCHRAGECILLVAVASVVAMASVVAVASVVAMASQNDIKIQL